MISEVPSNPSHPRILAQALPSSFRDTSFLKARTISKDGDEVGISAPQAFTGALSSGPILQTHTFSSSSIPVAVPAEVLAGVLAAPTPSHSSPVLVYD